MNREFAYRSHKSGIHEDEYLVKIRKSKGKSKASQEQRKTPLKSIDIEPLQKNLMGYSRYQEQVPFSHHLQRRLQA